VQVGPCMPTCVADRMLDHDGAAKGAGANPRGRHGFARIFLCEGADTRVLYLNIWWEIFTPDGSGLSSLVLITHTTYLLLLSLSFPIFYIIPCPQSLLKVLHLPLSLSRIDRILSFEKHCCYTRLQLLDGCLHGIRHLRTRWRRLMLRLRRRFGRIILRYHHLHRVVRTSQQRTSMALYHRDHGDTVL
jgi:hypothetical protein